MMTVTTSGEGGMNRIDHRPRRRAACLTHDPPGRAGGPARRGRLRQHRPGGAVPSRPRSACPCPLGLGAGGCLRCLRAGGLLVRLSHRGLGIGAGQLPPGATALPAHCGTLRGKPGVLAVVLQRFAFLGLDKHPVFIDAGPDGIGSSSRRSR